MKRFLSIILCVALMMSFAAIGATVSAAPNGVDFLRQGTLSCTGATAKLQNGALAITATAADQEVSLTVNPTANVNTYSYWDGVVESTVPFDIVFYDKTYNKWIYASANFCYEFENNNGATKPLPAGRHQVSFSITGAYTWDNQSLPADASIRSIIFILRAAGTLTVERCAMTDGTAFTAYPDTVYQMEDAMITAIPPETSIDAFCQNARLQLDTFQTSVKKNGNASDFVGTGDTVTLNNGTNTTSYTAVVRGDFDASGTVTTSDVRELIRYCIDSSLFNNAQKAAADILTDQTVNTNDARALLMGILKPPSMTFAQERVVQTETFLSESKFDMFMASATRDTLVAGLSKNLVPQGMAQSHKTGLLYMSAYASDGTPSSVLVYDARGQFCAEYIIYDKNGSPCTKHLGGVAVTETTLFLSYDGDGAYRVAAIPLSTLVTKGTQKVTITTLYELPVATSFLSYYDGWLWAGNFYLPSGGYDLMRILNFTTSGYGCYIAGFDLSTLGNARLAPASGQTYPTPDVLMAAVQKVQGMAYDTKTNTAILSLSWGRKNDSTLVTYAVDFNAKPNTTITLNNTAVPCFVLSAPKRTITTLPMAEGITLDGNGAVRVLYESGANKYSDGLHRTDYIWRYQY